MRIWEWFNELRWQEHALIGLVMIRISLLVLLYSGFVQLPSPIYGGDLYHQLGAINHVKYGGNPFVSFDTLEGGPTYFPMYTLIVGGTARLFNLDAMHTMLFYSYIFVGLSMILVYLLGKKLFKNPTVGLSLVFLYSVIPYGIIKYTEFERFVIYPLFFLTFLNYLSSRKLKWAALSGLVLGIAGLSHGMGLMFIFPLIGLVFFYEVLASGFWKGKFNSKRCLKKLPSLLKDYGIILGFGFLISLLHWHYAIKAVLSGVSMGSVVKVYKFTFSNMLPAAVKRLFSFQNFYFGLITALFIAGIVLLLLVKKQDKKLKLIFWAGLVLILSPFHFLISKPLLGFSVAPNHMILHAYPIAIALFGGLGLLLISKGFKQGEKIVYVILTLLVIGNFLYIQDNANNDRWMKAGRQELSPYLLASANWIDKNTDVNDVFLSTKEISSAINSLTGRKFVTLKQSHVSLFLDSFQREIDLALILYGNNDTLRDQLLKKYSVDYLYWDVFWFRSDFTFNDKGQITGFFDPIAVPWNLNTVAIFDAAGIEYVEQNMSIDPSKRSPNPMFNTEELLVVIPSNTNAIHPWNDKLDAYLTPVVSFKQQGQVASKIFSVKVPTDKSKE